MPDAPMPELGLGPFIVANRDEIIARCASKLSPSASTAGAGGVNAGIPGFIDQMVEELEHGRKMSSAIHATALRHGRHLFADGFSVGQLVHDYGGVCQAVTNLAVEKGVQISVDDFRTLNRCLDDAIASAAAEYLNQERVADDDQSLRLRNLVYVISSAFDILREGKVGVAGATGDLLQRSLVTLRGLVDHLPK